MPGEHEVEAAGGLSRRQLLTRGAIAGGLVWAAPIIRTTAAYATTANGTERPCTTFYMVTINPAGKVLPEPRDLNTRDVPPAIRQWFADNPGVQVQFPAVTPLLTQTSTAGWAVLLPEVTGPNAAGRQCRMVIGWDEKRHKYAEGFVDPNPPLASEVGRRLIFPCPDPNHTGGGGGDDDGKGSGNDGDDDDKTGGGDHSGDSDDNSGNPNDGGCATGHDDGDHDGDDLACDPTAVSTPPEDASSTSGTSATSAAPDPTLSASSTTDTSTAVGSSQIASDSSASTISSDSTSKKPDSDDANGGDGDDDDTGGGGGGGGTPNGPGECINLVYLIYCCPQ